MEYYLIKLFLCIYFITDLYKDGFFKKNGKLLYFCKWIMYACMFGIGMSLVNEAYYETHLYDTTLFNWEIYVSILLLKKPLSDYSYSYGYFRKLRLFIGTSNASDKLLHKIGLVELNFRGARILPIIYSFVIFIGVFL